MSGGRFNYIDGRMSDREKLIWILDHFLCLSGRGEDGCDLQCNVCRADYLLDNGVTFGEDINVPSRWIPVAERLPDELPKLGNAWAERVRPSVDVLVKRKGLYELYTAWYSYSRKEWIDTSETLNLGDSVIYWMPLPEPPKEE